jgi:phosphopantothenoylcysteine decarboxylase/phosphopantothenate--cysteine ligase
MADLKGKRVVITAGPTYEAIDPVRFIGNHSTGKMGIALAERAANLGATVTLICGPTSVPSSSNVNRINVTSAQEMFDRVHQLVEEADILILAAAVADYRPKKVALQKLKKQTTDLVIELEATPDILASVGAQKRKGQLLVGFALETDNELENAEGKLQRKNCDMIILNSLRDAGAGFGHDTNKITILTRHNNITTFELKSKAEVAEDILQAIMTLK